MSTLAGQSPQGFFIVGKTVSLRPIIDADNSSFVQWLNDPEARRYLRVFFPITTENEKKWLMEGAEVGQKSERITFAIVFNDGDHPIGDVGLHEISWPDGTAWLGLMIGDKACWGAGCATEAGTLLLDYAFGELGMRKIIAGIYEPNIRSRRVAKKLGFTLAGVFKDDIFVDGKYRDGCIYELFLDEWLEHKQCLETIDV
ncbi:MAG TPA: GNAT family protein [Candidatus Lokiarchaeia archaeon]|nr:GNAT family protein [Candidatus Lokiarchaeia archaeon]